MVEIELEAKLGLDSRSHTRLQDVFEPSDLAAKEDLVCFPPELSCVIHDRDKEELRFEEEQVEVQDTTEGSMGNDCSTCLHSSSPRVSCSQDLQLRRLMGNPVQVPLVQPGFERIFKVNRNAFSGVMCHHIDTIDRTAHAFVIRSHDVQISTQQDKLTRNLLRIAQKSLDSLICFHLQLHNIFHGCRVEMNRMFLGIVRFK
mmetsp:Transcript_21358/g.48245  ORF Transcript_21358/g.48245 Transcript_21358/m.48245 type:complete len:201 (+) Transcript_21358:76-678(+)